MTITATKGWKQGKDGKPLLDKKGRKIAVDGSRFRAQVRSARHGYAEVTKDTYDEALEWKLTTLRELKDGKTIRAAVTNLKKVLVCDLIDLFDNGVATHMASYQRVRHMMNRWRQEPFAQAQVQQPSLQALLQAYVTRRSDEEGLLPASIIREKNVLVRMFRWAKEDREWDIAVPLIKFAKGKKGNKRLKSHRTVIWSDDQLRIAVEELGGLDESRPLNTAKDYLPWLLMVLRHNGQLRLGTVCKIPLASIAPGAMLIEIDGEIIKNREDFTCPLTEAGAYWLNKLAELRVKHGANRKLDTLVQIDGKPMIDAQPLSDAWCKFKGRTLEKKHPDAAFLDLNLHDLRHTWTTEMVEIIPSALELARITGRTDLDVLMDYYNPTAIDMAKRMRERIAAKNAPTAPAVDQAALIAAAVRAAMEAVQAQQTPANSPVAQPLRLVV